MNANLEKYNKKRNFEKSKEPQGGKEKNGEKKLHYVIQHHLARKDHFDFRLEYNGTMLSFAVPKGPSLSPNDKRLAIKVEDHPLEYRHFEGTIPKGEYGGGTVMIWDKGYWECDNIAEQLKNGVLKFTIYGKRLQGKWTLIKIKNNKEKDKQDNYLLIKEKDEYVDNDFDITKYNTSITTGRTMEEISQNKQISVKKNPFIKTDIQLAKLVTKVPKGDNWLFEIKYDGYRIVSYIENGKVLLFTRNNHNYTDKFNKIVESLEKISENRAMVLDGEMTILDDKGKSDFGKLQNYIKSKKDNNLVYFIFDILALDGEDLREKPLIERKNILEKLLENAPTNIIYSKHIQNKGEEFFKLAKKNDLEGIVGKKANSKYTGTRNGDWVKIKCYKRQEFVIGGYTISNKINEGISSLLLGYYENDKLCYAGRVGTGFSGKKRKELEEKFKKEKIESSPFIKKLKESINEKIIYINPVFVAEVSFAEWTQVNQLRQASFKGLRNDKNPNEIVKEMNNYLEIDNKEIENKNINDKEKENIDMTKIDVLDKIKITHPDKVIYENPKITKGDVVAYYNKVADLMLPYIENRILSLVRCPNGVKGESFFRKHPSLNRKEIKTIAVTNSDNETKDYMYIDNKLGIISEVQMGTIEFHTWASRIEKLNSPNIMIFDLDPDEGMDIERVRKGVKDVKSILDELGLKSFLKTSGGKGYHIVVPINREFSWDTFHDFAKGVAVIMEKKWPEYYTSNVKKSMRKNRIFIDWIRNGKGATSVAPYSLRAREKATVSMPIFWEELDTIAPSDITMEKALKRINDKNPWEDFFSDLG